MVDTLPKTQRTALEELRAAREMMKHGVWWGTATRLWIVGDDMMNQLKRKGFCRIDSIGDSHFAVLTPKGERVLAS